MKIKMPFWKKKPTASERREQLRQALLNGNNIITNTGEVKEVKDRDMKIKIPEGKLGDSASEKRKKLRQALLNDNINYYEEKPEDIIARKAKYKK